MKAVLQIGLVAAVLFGSAAAQAQTPFFQGKTLNIVINFSAGGPTDTEGRLVARHLAQHIPGNPAIVIRNIGGAGGAIGVNDVGQMAASDGLTLGYFTGTAFISALQEPSLRVDLTKMPLIAVGPGISVAYMRSDFGGGVHKPEDIMSKSEFWIGGLAPDSDKDVRLRMQLDLLGLHYKYLTGYPGTADIRLALQRNEVQATAELMPAYRASVEPLVQKGEITPLWYDIVATQNVANSPDTAGIPATSFLDFYKQQHKTGEGTLLYRSFLVVNKVSTDLQRLILMPPSSPPAAVAALRQAFVALGSDPDFAKDSMKTIKYVPRFEQRDMAAVASGLKPSPEIVSFLHTYIEEGQSARKH